MKTKIVYLISCFIFCLSWQVNAQNEFAPIGAKWYYNCCANGTIINSHLNYVVSEKDTIIEDNSCRVLRQYFDNSSNASETYIIKQEQGKVYHYHQDQFNLLFNFDAEVNDTVEFTFKYQKYDNYPLYKDTVLSAKYRVDSITTNAQNLKTFATTILDKDKYDSGIFDVDEYIKSGMDILPWSYSYTEKLGHNYEFMPLLDNVPEPATDNYPILRCYSDPDFSFVSEYWSTTSFPCDYSIATTINTPQEDHKTIYPNPFSDHIFVSAHNERNIEIIDVSGKVVFSSKLSNGINEISTNHFLKGVYLVKIQNRDDRIQTFKMVKP